jgi:hypothetical protein
MPLFQRRQSQRQKAERIARGEAIELSSTFDESARTRILYAITDSAPDDLHGWDRPSPASVFIPLVRGVLLREWGETTLAQKPDETQDFASFLISRATDGQVPDVIEAVFEAFQHVNRNRAYPKYDEDAPARSFRAAVNRILDEHNLAFQVVDNEVVPRDSMVMHAEIVTPALSLLRGKRAFASVERAFHDALRELKPGGNPSDAITDAGTAVQEMLVSLGADGNALGPLLASARKRGLLGPHDSKLAEGVQKIGEWISADRSARGDSHAVRDATVDDAWLAVHVAGALIVRLEKRME